MTETSAAAGPRPAAATARRRRRLDRERHRHARRCGSSTPRASTRSRCAGSPRAFDTGPASLYAHVDNKEALLRLALDLAIGELEPVPATSDDWQQVVRDWSLGVHAMLAAPQRHRQADLRAHPQRRGHARVHRARAGPDDRGRRARPGRRLVAGHRLPLRRRGRLRGLAASASGSAARPARPRPRSSSRASRRTSPRCRPTGSPT